MHPTAGATLVGVRRPLVAFNVNLRSRDLELACDIARLVRERDGGLPGVRALGLELPRAGLVQVSMNLEDWERTLPHDVVERIAAEAAARGVEVDGSELVGLMPAGAAVAAAGRELLLAGFDASRVLELRLLTANERRRPQRRGRSTPRRVWRIAVEGEAVEIERAALERGGPEPRRARGRDRAWATRSMA